MNDKTQLAAQGAARETDELLIAPVQDPAAQITECATKLAKFGGYEFMESAIGGTKNLNPASRARKKIFLSEEDRKEERKNLLKTLETWYALLQESADAAQMLEKCQQQAVAAERTLNENLSKALDASRQMEESYRSLQLFFSNALSSKINNLTLVNVSLDQLKDLDNPKTFDVIDAELREGFDRLDLRENYGLMVIPGYLGKNTVVDKWSRMAYNNKAMLVTDFANLDTAEEIVEMFDMANMTSGDAHKANVIMTCNWLVGRGKHGELEEENLHIPPSVALAGKIYSTLMSQPAAGNKHGVLSDVDSVKCKIVKSDLSILEKAGLVPMVNEYGKVLAFSAKTLFTGDNIGLQTYSVVRVFDYVSKVLMDFLNRRAFENFNVKLKVDLTNQILKYLDTITGPSNLIEKFKFLRLEQDPKQKDRIFVDLQMTPFFPAKSFLIKLDGTKGDDSDIKWDAQYA